MATTTTNYGFDIPQSTDLVKDGATAIATLGQDIDTAMNTALGTKKAGMVLLNTTSFSGVSSVTVNPFATTYTNYVVIFDSVLSTSTELRMRFTNSSGSPVTTAGAYGYTSNYASSSLVQYANNSSNSEVQVNVGQSDHSGVFTFITPFSGSLKTKVIFDLSGSTNLRGWGAATQTSAAQNNGFQFYPATGTFTGTVATYGFNI